MAHTTRSMFMIRGLAALLACMTGFAAPGAPAAASTGAGPVNKTCPVRQGVVKAESPTRQFKGQTIGFCCAGCESKWDAKPDEEKLALLTAHAPEAIVAIQEAEKPTPKAGGEESQPSDDPLSKNPAVRLARNYLSACEKADAAALNALFLDNGRATVSENASDEGSWETYRDHHLLPEIKEMPGFKMTVRKEDVQTFGTTSVVRQIGSFTVPLPNHPDVTRNYDAAVTYVVVDDGGSQKIAHLHWSSRAERKPAASPETTKPGTDHGHTGGHEHK